MLNLNSVQKSRVESRSNAKANTYPRPLDLYFCGLHTIVVYRHHDFPGNFSFSPNQSVWMGHCLSCIKLNLHQNRSFPLTGFGASTLSVVCVCVCFWGGKDGGGGTTRLLENLLNRQGSMADVKILLARIIASFPILTIAQWVETGFKETCICSPENARKPTPAL